MTKSAESKIILTPAGLERRLKRHLLKETQEFIAVTTPGLESMLEREVRALPLVTFLRNVNGGVEFSGPLTTIYQAGLKLRTASRVLMRVDSFVAKSYPELYNKARRIPWELFTGFEKNVAIDATSRSSRLHHTENIVKSVFDALTDHQEQLGVRMVLDKKSDRLRFAVRLADDTCTISVDATGASLYKRGYRLDVGHAPLRESVAAALLMQVGWDKFPVIVDPLCGSGTLAIEAALLARSIAPGLKKTFAFSAWPSFNQAMWERLKREAQKSEKAATPIRLMASDLSNRAIAAARGNAERAGVIRDIAFSKTDCFDFNRDGSSGARGLIIANLPYGKRAFADGSALNDFYKRWGEHLRTHCRGWTYGFLTADCSFARMAGLRTQSELRFENGGLEVYFVHGTIP
jgi:putative N6-adenine-specific DNA methylase